MDKKDKIKNILNAIKLNVENLDQFEGDVESVLGMFNEIGAVDASNVDATLHRKQVTLGDLRADEAVSWDHFREDMRGKYFKVPNVSKK